MPTSNIQRHVHIYYYCKYHGGVCINLIYVTEPQIGTLVHNLQPVDVQNFIEMEYFAAKP